MQLNCAEGLHFIVHSSDYTRPSVISPDSNDLHSGVGSYFLEWVLAPYSYARAIKWCTVARDIAICFCYINSQIIYSRARFFRNFPLFYSVRQLPKHPRFLRHYHSIEIIVPYRQDVYDYIYIYIIYTNISDISL